MAVTTDSHSDTVTRRWRRPLEGLRGVRGFNLAREVSAGPTVAALVVPLNIGYAQIAGLPAAMGLYAAIVALVIFALFISSRNVGLDPLSGHS